MKIFPLIVLFLAFGCRPLTKATSDELMHAVDQSDNSWMTLWSNDVVKENGDVVRCWYKVTIPEHETKGKDDGTLNDDVILRRMASSSEIVTSKAISNNQLSANLERKGVELEKAEHEEAMKNWTASSQPDRRLVLGNSSEWRAWGNKPKKENASTYESRVRWVQYVAAKEHLTKEDTRTSNGQVRSESEKDRVDLKQLLALEATIRETNAAQQNHDCEAASQVFAESVPTQAAPIITELKSKKCDPQHPRFRYSKNSYVIVEEDDKCVRYTCHDNGWVVSQANASCNDW